MNADGDPPLRPPPPRRAASVVAWIAGTLLVIAAAVFAWDPPPSPEVAAATMAMPSLPSLPDPAAPAPGTPREDGRGTLSPTGASGTELIEVCGVGWVPPDASGAADRTAVAGDRDVLASQRALLDALRRRDGEVGDAMATVLELQGAGRDNVAGTPFQALFSCGVAASAPSATAECAGRDDDRRLASTLVERLAKRATATREPRVYALAMQQCQWARGEGSCALLNADQWARIDDGNALPWLHILQRARERNDAAQIADALHHIGAAKRYEDASYAVAGRVADRAGASDVDVIAALLVAVDALGATWRVEPFAALTEACKGPALGDANRRDACERAAETLAERSDSLTAVVIGAAVGRRVGWPAERVDSLRGLQVAAQDEASSTAPTAVELPSSCGSARRILASFSLKGRGGEAQTARAWAAAHGGTAALAARLQPAAPPPRGDDAARSDPDAAPAAADAASGALVAAAATTPTAAEPAASSAGAAPAPENAASGASPYSATPPPDR